MPPGADGITLGSLVIVRRTSAAGSGFDELLRHELVHVGQWREMGVIGFAIRYAGDYLRWRMRGYGHDGAYRRIALEVEARVREPPRADV